MEFTTLEWDASQNKQNNHRNRKYGGCSVGETPSPPDTRFASDIFVYKQGLGGRSTAAHGIDPHRMVHRGAVLVGAPVC